MKVALPPAGSVTVVLMLPVPLAAPQLEPAGAVQVQVTPVSAAGNVVGHGRQGDGARAGIGDDDGVVDDRARRDAGLPIGLGDREIGLRAGELVRAAVEAAERRACLVVDVERRGGDGRGGCW